MNDTIITILPTQKAIVQQATKIEIWNAIKRIETNSTPQIIQARKFKKGDDYYEHVKEGSPHFIFGSIPGKDKKIANIQKYTGFLFCDIDQNAIDECAYDLQELKSAIFDRYPFVVFCNISFGGRGLGFVLNCPNLITHNCPSAYEQAYKTFASKIKQDFELNLKLDSVCFNPNRQTTLSYDPDILFREYPLAYTFNFDATIPYNEGKTTEREIDLSLSKNENLFSMFTERFRNFYTSVTWVNTETGEPVKFHVGLTYDKDKFHLTRHFDQSKLLEHDPEFRNESDTLVYLPSGIAATTLMTGTNFKIKHGSRSNFMQAFVLNYLFLLKASNKAETVGKFYVYNLLLALNTMMYDKSGINQTPLQGNEINILTQVIMDKFTSGEFSPGLSKKSHIRTADCLSKVSYLYKTGSKPRTIIVNEINRIKHVIQNKLIDEHIEHYRQTYPDCTVQELTVYLNSKVHKLNGEKYEEDTIKRKVRKKVSFSDSPSSINFGEGTKEEQKYQNDTLQRITRCVDQLMVSGAKVKQKEVIKLLSKYMCRSTVLRHWSKVKEKIAKHNQSLNEINLKSKPLIVNVAYEGGRSWVIYKGNLKTIIAFKMETSTSRLDDREKRTYVVLDKMQGAIGRTVWAQHV